MQRYLPRVLSPIGRLRLWVGRIQPSLMFSGVALTLSILSFYRSYIYVKQDLQVTGLLTGLSVNKADAAALHITLAFINAGNRDAAVLSVSPRFLSGSTITGKLRYQWSSFYGEHETPESFSLPPGQIRIVTVRTTFELAHALGQLQSSRPSDELITGACVVSLNAAGTIFESCIPIARSRYGRTYPFEFKAFLDTARQTAPAHLFKDTPGMFDTLDPILAALDEGKQVVRVSAPADGFSSGEQPQPKSPREHPDKD